ncbi:hypothetical protein [Sessilibacter corallicola]|uniref:hypothetical protein n=1 Tax=Sessilibacter corallicola TaxID=2904075 RepID=UPI00333E72D6
MNRPYHRMGVIDDQSAYLESSVVSLLVILNQPVSLLLSTAYIPGNIGNKSLIPTIFFS